MPRTRKPTPKNQEEISQGLITPYQLAGAQLTPNNPKTNRGNNISLEEDKSKPFVVGLEDINNAIFYYFNNVIKPTYTSNGIQHSVPVIYGDSERWKSIQKDGYYRDKEGKIQTPIIALRRETVEKDRDLGNKLDGNRVHLYAPAFQKTYSKKNQYDAFSALTNRIPVREYILNVVPDYIKVTYNCIISCNYVEQLDKLIEAINYSSDSYWGEKERFQFRVRIDNFSGGAKVSQGEERIVTTNFDLILHGYIITDTVNKEMSAYKKSLSKAQIFITSETSVNLVDQLQSQNILPTGGNAVTMVNPSQTIIINQVPQDQLTYINTNLTKTANSISGGNTATINNTNILSAPSPLPSTSINSFYYFINGQNIPQNYVVSISNSGANVQVVFNTTLLGYTLTNTDTIVVIGKFT